LIELHRAKLAERPVDHLRRASRPVSGRKAVVFGVRGDVNMHLTAYGAKRPLHSGNYGNWAPNPADRLVALLASMKDDKGRVLIKGFYDDYVMLLRERAHRAQGRARTPTPCCSRSSA
jgi:acetylornithine deacetylase/succinyl-diaminopimelate desuccinylase-like protein